MTLVPPILMLIVASGLFLMIRAGRKVLADPFAEPVEEPERWPSAAIVIPVSGADPGIPGCLRSILNQDYPDFEVVFSVKDAEDPAAALIAGLIVDRTGARLVHAGEADRGGQKNHNLLAGLKVVSASREVLVFCDSTHEARRDWLRELVRPLALGKFEAANGFHLAVPVWGGFIAWGRAISALFIYLMKCFPATDQPWGGATAIRADLFHRLEVDRVWESHSFDDACLNVLLRKNRRPLAMTPRAVLYTFLGRQTLAGWRHWVLRQWLGLKFYSYWNWAGAGVACWLCTLLLAFSVFRVAAAVSGWMSVTGALVPALFLSVLAFLGSRLRGIHPRPTRAVPWLAAFFATILLASWVHMETWFTMELPWKGIVYRVAPGGKVLEIRKK